MIGRDTQLEDMAKRIRAKAMRRAGELLKMIDARGDHMKTDASVISQTSAARAMANGLTGATPR